MSRLIAGMCLMATLMACGPKKSGGDPLASVKTPSACGSPTQGVYSFREWGPLLADVYSCQTYAPMQCDYASGSGHSEMFCTGTSVQVPSGCTLYSSNPADHHQFENGQLLQVHTYSCGERYGLNCMFFKDVSGSNLNELICQ